MPNPFRKNWGASSDSDWLQALLKACLEPEVGGVVFPTLPDREVQRTIQGNSQETAIRGSMMFYRYVRDVAFRHGHPVSEQTRLLDFGSGWGRMVRPFMRDMDLAKIYAVEPSPEWCRTARRCNPYVSFLQTDYRPPLPFRDKFFDHIIAYSIFTHLPEDMFDAWMDEFARVLVPGGILVFTFLGDGIMRTLSTYPDPLPEGDGVHFWHRILLDALKQRDGRARYSQDEFVFLRTHSSDSYGDTFVSPELIRRKLSKRFRLLEVDDASLAQDVVAATLR